jgi:hypothetical protein
MKDVYLKAAEIIWHEETEYSCVAIKYACKDYGEDDSCPSRHLYEKLFHPNFGTRIITTRLAWGDYWDDTYMGRKNCRILALLFMHWISQD